MSRSPESANFVVQYANPDKGFVSTCQPASLFENHVVPDFTIAEELTLVTDYKELKKQGLSGVLHIVFRGSLTGLSVEDSIPQSMKSEGFYDQLHIFTPNDLLHPRFRTYLDTHPDYSISIEKNGTISAEIEKRLSNALKNRVGIILGGGPGHPEDSVYKPVIYALNNTAKNGTPIAGICLGQQLLGTMLHAMGKSEQVQEGIYELGSQVESITQEGKNHLLFKAFGDSIVVVHVNEFHWNPNNLPDTTILTRNARGEPSAITFPLDSSGQAITWQGHPEFPMKGNEHERTFEVEGKKITIPEGISPAYAGMVQFFVGSENRFRQFKDIYKMTREDLQNLVDARRLPAHPGKTFYGRIFQHFSNKRLYPERMANS